MGDGGLETPGWWARIRANIFGTSGMFAALVAISAAGFAFVKEITAIEERQNVNSEAREKLMMQVLALRGEVEQIKGETEQHYREDASKEMVMRSLETRVSKLEADASIIVKGHEENAKRIDDLRSDLTLRHAGMQSSFDAMRQRLEVLADRIKGAEAR